MSKQRIKIMIKGPNRRTYFRKGPIALHVSENSKENIQEPMTDAVWDLLTLKARILEQQGIPIPVIEPLPDDVKLEVIKLSD